MIVEPEIEWMQILLPVPPFQAWGATHGDYSFVVVEDTDGSYTASMKNDGRTVFLGTRPFRDLFEARDACETFLKTLH